jgi:hypothetical protein
MVSLEGLAQEGEGTLICRVLVYVGTLHFAKEVLTRHPKQAELNGHY